MATLKIIGWDYLIVSPGLRSILHLIIIEDLQASLRLFVGG